jgi:hypothetical protein
MLITNSARRFALASVAAIPTALMATTAVLAADVVFMLNNETSDNLIEFYASPTTADNWEDNIIPEGDFVASGETVRVTIPDDGRGCLYDILGVFDDGSEIDEYNVNICEMSEYTYSE